MTKFLKNQRELVVLALFFVVIGGLGYFVIMPLLKSITLVRDGIQEEAIKQDIRRQKLNELPKIREQFAKINNQQNKIDILLSKDQAVVLIERLEKLSQDTGNTIVISINDGLQQAANPALAKAGSATANLVESLPSNDYLKLTISLTGDYDGLFKFISGLETFEYYGDIIGINISHSTDSGLPSAAGAAPINGVLNPFNAQLTPGASSTNTAAKQNGSKLDTSLEVVFYTKK